jgi:hypothetical protein
MVQLSIQRCACGCGRFLEQGRSDKFFFNRACRARYRRYRKHLPRYTVEITNRLTLMEKYLKDPNMCELAIAEFKAVKTAIDILFDNNNIRRVK